MDYRKQIREVEGLLAQCKKLEHRCYNLKNNPESLQEEEDDAADELATSLDDIAIVLVAAYESHRVPDLAGRIISDLKNQPLLSNTRIDGHDWHSPRLFRASRYYEALKHIAVPTLAEKTEGWLKLVGALASILGSLGIGALLIDASDQKEHQKNIPAISVTTGTRELP